MRSDAQQYQPVTKMWLTCFFRYFQPQRNYFPRFAKVHFLCPERYLISDHFYVGLCISPTAVQWKVVVRSENHKWKERNGPRGDLRAEVCRVRGNAVVLLTLWNLFYFSSITVMHFEKWGVLLMHIVDVPVTRRSLQPKKKCEK